ncbi:MAG TPA: NAD(P)-binding domain-containing protein [Chloroflexota bacterium]|nr:NAD(P)-binding domain-containing protein [Chloroflexota bacterium]
MNSSSVAVVIIGAGPLGLGLATHLRARGVEHRIFGSPMQTWRDMPRNMNLKSLGFATSIPTPRGHPTFPEYCRARGLEEYEPIEFATFAEYGMAIQRDFVPYVEDTLVTDLQRAGDEFALTLGTGERLRARRVVVAVGLGYFPRIPEVLSGLPAEQLSHTWGPKDFDSFAGKDVVVVGGGSSALETAVLLHEHGARAQVLVRRDVSWGGKGAREWERSLIDRIRVPISSIGHGRENWVLEHIPWLMHYLPASKRIPFTRRHLGPAPAWWLHDRVAGQFPVHVRTSVIEATSRAGKVFLRVQVEGAEREIVADHVVAGTGYEVDLDRITFMSRDLRRQIRRYDLAPRLSRHFESSVPGLYFIGPIAALSFGPLARFVAGAPFTIPAVANHLAHGANPLASVWRRLAGVRSSTPLSPAAPDRIATRIEL